MFGENLREARLAAGLTQTELGKLVGVPPNYISIYEAGALDTPIPRAWAIADVLQMTLAELIGDVTYPIGRHAFVVGDTPGQRMLAARRHAKLSRRELARATEIGPRLLLRYEFDKRVPSLFHLVKIAEVLGVSVDAFRPSLGRAI